MFWTRMSIDIDSAEAVGLGDCPDWPGKGRGKLIAAAAENRRSVTRQDVVDRRLEPAAQGGNVAFVQKAKVVVILRHPPQAKLALRANENVARGRSRDEKRSR